MDLVTALQSSFLRLGVSPGARLGIAVSGGADSSALLHLAVRAGMWRLHVLHVDHGLRPGSSGDADAVVRAARELGLPCSVLTVDVPRGPRRSLEADAREARYAALDASAEQHALSHVATAHTLDDQAETVLYRAVRGTGVRGLRGVLPVRGRFVRPLLDVRRDAVRDWLVAEGAGWTEDPTNDDTRFDRNWLRHDVMPLLAARRPGVARALARLAEIAAMDSDALDELAAGSFARSVRVRAGWIELDDDAFAGHTAVARRVVLLALAEAGAPVDADTAARVLERAPSADIGNGVTAWRVTRGVVLAPATSPAPLPIELPARGVAACAAWGVTVRVSSGAREPAWRWRCTLPDDPGLLAVRGRLPGDRIVTAAGTRKVQDILVDAKVPRFARDRVPVLCCMREPVAVLGLAGPSPVEHGVVVDVEPMEGGWWSLARPRASS